MTIFYGLHYKIIKTIRDGKTSLGYLYFLLMPNGV